MTKVPSPRRSKKLARAVVWPQCVLAVMALAATAVAQGPTYQRYRTGHEPYHHPHQPRYFAAPQIESGWYQRPYPYHLDYYRMRWGGTYEPYFGNLYGPPAIVVPPTYSPYPLPYNTPYPGGPVGPGY